jgi:Flp pilus assembly protein TadG
MKLKRFASDESGSSLVEFGVSACLLLMVVFGIIDCSRAIYIDHFCAESAREATRYAMVRGYTWNGTPCVSAASNNCLATVTDIVNYVTNSAPPGVSATNLTVRPTWTGKTPTGDICSSSSLNTSPGCVINVSVNYSFNFVLPFLPKNTLVLSSSSAMAISQ